MTRRTWACGLASMAILAGLAGCERGADSGATQNPVAPGRPGTGNPVEQVAPQPGSVTESPQIGGARGQVPAGVTGSGGTTDTPGELQGRSRLDEPGTGLQGGLDTGGTAGTPLVTGPTSAPTGTGTTAAGAGTAGSTNLTPGNSFGN